MDSFYAAVPYVLIILMVATFGVLIVGVVAMGSPRVSPAFRNKLMRVRVGVHALAVILLLALMALSFYQPGQ
jgi:hypothetical protein